MFDRFSGLFSETLEELDCCLVYCGNRSRLPQWRKRSCLNTDQTHESGSGSEDLTPQPGVTGVL